MENFLAFMKLISAMLPIVSTMIHAVEEAIPQPGQGPAKLQLIKTMLSGAYAQVTNATVAFDSLWPMLQGVITALVAVYNTAGAFKKATAPAA